MCTCKPEGKVNACPETKEAWEARAEAKRAGCHYEEVYHCLSDKDGNKWEKCLQKTLILQGKSEPINLCLHLHFLKVYPFIFFSTETQLNK